MEVVEVKPPLNFNPVSQRTKGSGGLTSTTLYPQAISLHMSLRRQKTKIIIYLCFWNCS